MCVVLNKELAVMGLLNAIVETMSENRNNDAYRVENVKITPQMVMTYSDLLRFADCGPIVKNFDGLSLIHLFNAKPSVFKKQQDNSYTICMHEYYESSLPPPASNEYITQFRQLLFEEMKPDINYPRSFLKYMSLCD